MKNDISNRIITVLLVSDNESDIHEVQKHIERTMGLACRVWYCANISRAAGFFKQETPEVDIVLLDLGLIGSGRPREIFQQMQHIVSDIPIIIFTEREDHELALLTIGEGAADNVTRGQFSTDPYKLRDAIEFSLARNKISKDERSQSVAALNRLGKRDAANFKILKEQGESNLAVARKIAATALQEAGAENAALLKVKDETIFWMSGGYSVDSRAD